MEMMTNPSTISKTRRNYRALVPKSSMINVEFERIEKPKQKRSRNGCLNCKRLKIKCNENKPECEYCVQTGKECVYKVPNRVQKSRKAVISNEPLQKLNSVAFQLNISKLELQLLKFYIDFGGNFFSMKDFNKDSYYFWRDDIPKLWCSSDLIKNALYTISSARLLANYDFDTSKEIYIEVEDQTSIPKMPYKVNLNNQAMKYMKGTLELIDMYQRMIDDETINLEEPKELLGQLLVAKKLCTGSRVILPRPRNNHKFTKIKDSYLLELMYSTNKFLIGFGKYGSMVKETQYSKVFDPELIPPRDYVEKFQNLKLGIIKHLEDYISEKVEGFDVSQISYQTAISRLENSCYQTLYFTYTMALFRGIVYMSTDIDYIHLLEQGDHIAMKIMFYTCCLNSIFHCQSYHRSGIHNEFLEFYVNYAKEKFDGGWEDDVDKNIYGWVEARAKSNYGFSLNAIEHVSEPVDNYLGDDNILQISILETETSN